MHFDVTLDEVKACNKQNSIVIQSTLALRVPRYYGHPADADKRQPPGETHKEMTETNSRYYGLSLLRKCRHFPAPKRDISLVFSAAIADTYVYFVKNPDSHDIKNKATLQ